MEPELVSLTGRVFYLSEDPSMKVSPKIGIVRGSKGTLFFDCGNSSKQLRYLEKLRIEGKLPNPSYLVISHFHEDHILNFPYFRYSETYGSRQTSKYVRIDKIVEERMEIDLGDIVVKVIPTPSAHSKGCLLIEADGILFLGDSLYPGVYEGHSCYDDYQLKEELSIIDSISPSRLVFSHHDILGGEDIHVHFSRLKEKGLSGPKIYLD